MNLKAYTAGRHAGAAIAGGTHYVTTAKRLAEEGIDPTQRVKAMPVAVRQLIFTCYV